MSEQNDFKTTSGIDMKLFYGPEKPLDSARASERPGEYPFTRGIQRNMYRGRLWTMRQYAGFGTAEQTNRRFRWLLEQGQTGLSTAFDLPTQIGIDADDPRAAGEVGRVGVHIGTIEDMERLFDQIPLDKVSTSLTINATAAVLLAFYVAIAKRRGVGMEKIRGTLQNDILKEFMARGTYIYPASHSLRLCSDVMEWSFKNLPNFNPISISGYHIREAGSDAVQEVAFTLADAEVYVKNLLGRGVGVDQAGPRLAFFFGCHNHFLEEIAKFRAARRVWARLMKEQFGAKDPKAQTLRFHVQTCGSTLTSQQPHNNVMRVAWQALAAVLGGAQSLHTNAFDEALALPTEESAQLALRTQQILAHETGVPDTVDPAAGSYAIEALTAELETSIEQTLQRLRDSGGMLRLIEEGVPQREIQDSAYRYAQEIEKGQRKIVGVNSFKLEDEKAGKKTQTLKISPKLEEDQIRKLKTFKVKRDIAAVASSLAELATAAQTATNLFPHILRCVENAATLGEVCDTLRKEFGEYSAG